MDSLGIKTIFVKKRHNDKVRKFFFLHMTFDASYCVVILNIARIIINQHFPKKKKK